MNSQTSVSPASGDGIQLKLQRLLYDGKVKETVDEALDADPSVFMRLASIVIKPEGWPEPSSQTTFGGDLLRQLIMRLKGLPADQTESVLKAIALIAVSNESMVKRVLSAETLDAVLSTLTLRNTPAIRGQATLTAVKFLEASADRADSLLTNFVVSRVQKQNAQGLIEAFSAAASLFPLVPSTGAALFLAQGFLADLQRLTQQTKDATLRKSALELLGAACTDGQCREAIAKECTPWLLSMATLKNAASLEDQALASIVLAKIQYKDQNEQQEEMTDLLKKLALSEDLSQSAIEGLAYRSTIAEQKELLARDSDFLKRLIERLTQMASNNSNPSPVLFGGLTILSNLTTRQPKQTSEEKRISQLKAYANKTKLPVQNPNERDEKVDQRVEAVINAGAVRLLVLSVSRATKTLLVLISSVLNALTVPLTTRGIIAQQGGLELALRLAELEFPDGDSVLQATKWQAALSLARLLVKLDPHLVFDAKRPASRAIRPLKLLLSDAEDPSQKDLWPVLEALMALTNLASLGDTDTSIADQVVDACWDGIENALLSPVLAIRRAAVQCVCNLCSMSEKGIGKYTDPNDKQGYPRTQILVAFIHEDEDRGVRLAAGAALASIVAFGGADRFLRSDRSIEKTVSMIKAADIDAQMRGLAILEGLLIPSEAASSTAEKTLAKSLLQGTTIVDSLVAAARNPHLAEQAATILQLLKQ